MTGVRWITITGPNAYCNDCPWLEHDDGRDGGRGVRLTRVARLHARSEGHQVRIERGQARWINDERRKEPS
jgi:hypothetical protein